MRRLAWTRSARESKNGTFDTTCSSFARSLRVDYAVATETAPDLRRVGPLERELRRLGGGEAVDCLRAALVDAQARALARA